MSSSAETLWRPDPQTLERARLTAFIAWLKRERGVDLTGYRELWEWSVADLSAFWGAVAEFFDVRLTATPETILGDSSMPGATWFPGATLNHAEHALRGPDGEPALIAIGEDGVAQEWTRDRLRREVGALAAHLRALGLAPGDRVVGYLPNVPEAVVAFLATAGIGAVWAICGPEFGTASVIARFGQLNPSVLIAGSGYHYAGRRHDRRSAVEEIRTALPTLRETVLVGEPYDIPDVTTWAAAIATPADPEFAQVPFGHPLWVLFSSGTTGVPKGIVHSHGGILLEHLKFLGLHADLQPGDRFFWHTSTSWMMWNMLVSGLLTGATIVLYDGSPTHPATDRLWQIVGQQRVTVFGTSAAYLMGCARADVVPMREHDLSALRALHSTGSPLPAEGFLWARDTIGARIPVLSGSGGTDVATGFVGGSPLQPVLTGEISGPCLGVDVQAWNDQGKQVIGEVGELVVVAPMPSMPIYFWNDPDGARYRAAYFETFPGVWRHGDWIEFTGSGGAVIHGRSDSTLNRMGVRMGTAEIYQAVEALPEIAEALAVGLEYGDAQYWMPLFVVLRDGTRLDDALRARIGEAIRRHASPRHVPDDIIEVPGIPHTLTGKKLEVPIKRVLLGRPAAIDPGAVDDAGLLQAFAAVRRPI